jgi:hypothetical protein
MFTQTIYFHCKSSNGGGVFRLPIELAANFSFNSGQQSNTLPRSHSLIRAVRKPWWKSNINSSARSPPPQCDSSKATLVSSSSWEPASRPINHQKRLFFVSTDPFKCWENTLSRHAGGGKFRSLTRYPWRSIKCNFHQAKKKRCWFLLHSPGRVC